MKIKHWLLLVALAFHGTTYGYQVVTHYDMSNEAVSRSALVRDPRLLPNLGIASIESRFQSTNGLNLDNFSDGCAHGIPLSVRRLIACGAQFEDHPFPRVVNHFYDPVYGRGLAAGESSPDWSLEEPPTSFLPQENSYYDAREYLFSALTYNEGANVRESAQARRQYWGRVFQTLGQVIHHLQDMTQPQHVRNDAHVVYVEPSHYEAYTANSRQGILDVLAGPAAEPLPLGLPGPLRLPRDFWENEAGTGISEFTNRNFLSKDTNWEINSNQQVATTEYPQPEWIGIVENVNVEELVPAPSDHILSYCRSRSATCTMSFYSSVHDIENTRASTQSIFDQYIALREVTYTRPNRPTYKVNRIFTLNRYNFATAHPHLVPRATAYSAALINYFFRGKLEIGPAAKGVYAVVDHNTPEGHTKGTGGFDRIQVSVRNVTPGGFDADGMPLIERVGTGGTLRAVIKYHLNDCYLPDLSGEYGSPGFGWQQCRSLDEYIAVSDSVPVPLEIDSGARDITFTFTSRLPINATDLYLQVVYRGPLGDETDAVIVETRDISEPTYLYNFSRWDQFEYCSAWPVVGGSCSDPMSYTEWCLTGFPTVADCNAAMGTTDKRLYGSADGSYVAGYDPSTYSVPQDTDSDIANELPFTPVFVSQAPVGTMTRVAVLLDAQPTSKTLLVKERIDSTHGSATFRWYTGTAVAVRNQLDENTGMLTPSVRYRYVRGVYVPEELYEELSQGTASPMPSLVLTGSEILP